MSPTNPSDPSAQDKFDREFEAFLREDGSPVANAYRKLPRVEPGDTLDQSVRAIAQQALLDANSEQPVVDRSKRPSRRWLDALSAAAVMVLAAGIVWRAAPQMWTSRESSSPEPAAATGTFSRTSPGASTVDRASESTRPDDLEKSPASASPSAAMAAAPASHRESAHAAATPAGGALARQDDKARQAQRQLTESMQLRRERAQPAAPEPFPEAAATKPMDVPNATYPAASPLSSKPARPVVAAPKSILDEAVKTKPDADSVARARYQAPSAVAKSMHEPSKPSTLAESPIVAAAPPPSPPPADSPATMPAQAFAPAPPPAAAAMPAPAQSADDAQSPPRPTPQMAAPSPAQATTAADEFQYRQRLQSHAAETRNQWIERIRFLLKTAQRDEALWNLREFRKQHPDYRLPDDLRGLR